jgi:flagellar capping protein FliD
MNGTLHIAAGPVMDGAQTNALVFLSLGLPQMNKDYTLKSGVQISQPNVLAGYNAHLGAGPVPMADGYYEATSGTLHFSAVSCDANGLVYTGTLTNVTFQGATISGMSIQVDPNGCTFMVPSMTFDIEVTTSACTP